jgi:recombinational DNA repair ATPase RecF
MRLRSLAVRNFRAFSNAEQPAIDLAHSVILCCGKNGSGKTSLFEALELSLTGSVERLAGIETVGQVLVNVREPDAPARLTLEWAHNGVDGATSAEINGNQKTLLRIPGQGGRDSGIDPVSIPKLIRSRFRDESGQGFRF